MEYGARSHAEHNLVWVGIFGAVGVLIMFVAYTFWPSTLSATSVTVGAKTFRADVADTEELRETGLTRLSVLAEDRALLMVYDYDEAWPVQTKGLSFPIDIVWLTHDKRIAYIAKNATPSSTGVYKPGGKTRYVLQLPSGAIVKYNIIVGRQVEFDYGG